MNVRLGVLGIAIACIGLPGLAADSDLQTLFVERHDGTEVTLSLEELDALKQAAFSTTTIWTEGTIRFSGVPLWTILSHAGAEGTKLRLVALNDCSIEMPVGDLEEAVPIVATRMDGETMSIRDKGPYWVIYPYDEGSEYATETNRSRSVWQLSRLVLIE